VVVFLVVVLVIGLLYSQGSFSFYTPTNPPQVLPNGTYTIQNVRHEKNPTHGNGSSFLSTNIINQDDTRVYMTNQNVDPMCQWTIKLEDAKTNAYSIQNVKNAENKAFSRGWSYLNVNVEANGKKSDTKIYFWNRPKDASCRWIIKKEGTSANVFSVQNVFYGFDKTLKRKESFLAVNEKDESDNSVFVSSNPGRTDAAQWTISAVVD